MKKLLFSLLLAGPAVAQAQSIDALSDKYGFRDAQFESPLTAFRGLTLVESGTNTKTCARATDAKKIGGAQISSIHYSFYKGKLLAVHLKTKGLINSQALLEALVAQYGPGEQPNEFLKEYLWPANRVLMSYKENAITNDASVIMMSNYLSDQKEADEKKAAKGAARDL